MPFVFEYSLITGPTLSSQSGLKRGMGTLTNYQQLMLPLVGLIHKMRHSGLHQRGEETAWKSAFRFKGTESKSVAEHR